MDFQNRAGGKTGTGGQASWSEMNRDRRERLRQLALETIDLAKDPYFMKNHLGSYECKLCLTLHNNEGSYLAHTQGKKHQANLARRAAKEAKEQGGPQIAPARPNVPLKKFIKIGRPGYKVTKQRDPATGQQSLLFQVDYPEIVDSIEPRHRFMSAYEQHIEPPDRKWQYLLFAAEPYETIGFKLPSREIDKSEGRFWTHWIPETKQFFVQFHYKIDKGKIESKNGIISCYRIHLMSEDKIERCNSAPVIKWLELSQRPLQGVSSIPLNTSFKPIQFITSPPVASIDDSKTSTNSARRPSSLRLRRHSSLTRGILQRVRTNSEADERPGEAKINTSFSLNSSTERLHLSPNPAILSPASNPGTAFFRPIGSPNSVFDSPGSASPESRCDYPLRSRQQPGRQMFKPANTVSRKRSSRSSMDTDDGHSVQSNAVKRIKLDLDWSDDRTVSNDSGTVEDIDGRSRRLDDISNSNSSIPYDWWTTHATTFRERIRRLSSESSISIDSITKEFNHTKESK